MLNTYIAKTPTREFTLIGREIEAINLKPLRGGFSRWSSKKIFMLNIVFLEGNLMVLSCLRNG